jgi:hypothetical protein
MLSGRLTRPSIRTRQSRGSSVGGGLFERKKNSALGTTVPLTCASGALKLSPSPSEIRSGLLPG